MGYGPGVFPYPNGAVCGLGSEGNCWVEPGNPVETLDQMCVAIEDDPPMWRRTPLTVARIGDLALVTFPGECTTSLGVDVRDAAVAALGGAPVAFLGYSQDYLFYSLHEWDWWQGGYEPSFSPWGPKQGDYLAARIAEVAGRFADPAAKLSFAPADPIGPPPLSFEPRKPMASIDAGTVVTQVAAQYAPADTVTFAVAMGDPWLVAPEFTLERQNMGGTWQPFARHDGTPVTSRGYEMTLTVSPEPSYRDAPDAAARRFVWTASLPLSRPVVPQVPIGAGRYRLVARGLAADASGATSDHEVASAPFDVQ
jgi:hypothetical protein